MSPKMAKQKSPGKKKKVTKFYAGNKNGRNPYADSRNSGGRGLGKQTESYQSREDTKSPGMDPKRVIKRQSAIQNSKTPSLMKKRNTYVVRKGNTDSSRELEPANPKYCNFPDAVDNYGMLLSQAALTSSGFH